MNLSIYDLTYEYIKRFWPQESPLSNKDKVHIKKALEIILHDGFTAEEIMDIMDNKKPKDMMIYPEHVQESILSSFPYKPKKEINLLKPDVFYWHPQLRILPDAPKRVLDYNTGEITKIEQPYFMEMKASYTLNDLTLYYLRQIHKSTDKAHPDYNKVLGGMNYLLSSHNIDTILHMIDAAANYIHESDRRPLKSPLDITDYLVEARNMMAGKMNAEIEAGDDKIVPKQRIPLGGSGSEVAK